MAISLSEYTASNNHKQANRLVKLWGLSNPRNENELIHSLDYLLIHGKEEFLNELAKIHPDKELILKANSTELKSNCGGFSNVDAATTTENTPSATTAPIVEAQKEIKTEPKPTVEKDDKISYLAIGVVAAIAMGILIKTY